MKIKVLKKDIENGVRGSNSSCPIALAIKRIVKKYKTFDCDTLQVNEQNIKYYKDPSYGRIEISLPKKAQYFIDRFDTNKRVNPFDFVLKIW